ncbi:MAG: hypothetical protein JNK78_16605 [Planctomycetes bacterium]|nr:hypothetical protein [Planctomycetota bacterium]
MTPAPANDLAAGTAVGAGACSRPMARVIGRLADLDRRERCASEQRLADALACWSIGGNREWIADGVRVGEPFLQISPAAADSVLAWEIEQLEADGYVRIGPFWVPVRWLRDPDGYRRVVQLVADHVLASPPHGDGVYVPKARAELQPLLAMWPFVLVLPTSRRLSIDDMIVARAWPVHPLGVVAAPSRADGEVRSPAEFFFHDVDHARFKVREDLCARGVDVPDPYVDGSTFDERRGEHRAVLGAAVQHAAEAGWRSAAGRSALVQSWLAAIDAVDDRDLADGARWLLFEMVHEKSLPIDVDKLTRALSTAAHEEKLAAKCRRGFFGADGPRPTAVARLGAARQWLRSVVAEAR